MIRINHINIKFKEYLIRDSSIQIDNGKVTAVKGKSGIGKTSLLYIVGLLDRLNRATEYYFDGKLLENSHQKMMSCIRRYSIGYVFQDSNILQHLNLYENFQYSFNLCYKKCSRKKVKELLEIVDLGHLSLKRMPATLSGGERQRLAIALALCKNPKIIILDEPTSALDKTHTAQIMAILKRIAVTQNKMILISTHSDTVLSFCDTIYEISNQRIELVKGQLSVQEKETFCLKKKKLDLSFYLHYNTRYFKYYRTTYLLLILICGLGITMLTLSKPIEDILIVQQNNIFNQNFNPEIFIANYTEDTSVCYFDMLPPLSDETLGQISHLDGVDQIYPFKEMILSEVILDNQPTTGNYIVQPYFSNEDDGARLSNNFLKYGESSNIGIEINGEWVDLEVASYYGATEGNPYSLNGGWIIRVPFQLLFKQDKNPSSSYVILCSDYTKVESLYHKIKEIDHKIGVRYNQRQVEIYTDAIKDIQKMALSIRFILFGIVAVSTIWIYSKHIRDRKLELCMLRANGLSRGNLLRLLFTEISMITLMISIVALGIWIIFRAISFFIFDFSVSSYTLSYFSHIVIYSLSLLFVSMVFNSKTILSSRISFLLRHL